MGCELANFHSDISVLGITLRFRYEIQESQPLRTLLYEANCATAKNESTYEDPADPKPDGGQIKVIIIIRVVQFMAREACRPLRR